MKVLIVLFAFVVGLFAPADLSEEIINAIRQGKSAELVKKFDEKVSVKIINQEDLLSRSQAEANLKYFFEKHAVKNFTSVNTSALNNHSQYITGTLETSNGRFRISVLIRHSLVTQFRIEHANE